MSEMEMQPGRRLRRRMERGRCLRWRMERGEMSEMEDGER